MSQIELEFLDHSNRIESEYSKEALEDAIKAWEYLNSGMVNLTFKTILHIHYLVMQRIRPDIAGELRDCDVWIGGSKKRFISYSLLADNIGCLCKEIERRYKVKVRDPIMQAKMCHIEFENIHPFEDGNGRVGRIIYNSHRLRLGLPIHVIHEGKEQMEYYKWFK